MNLANTKISRTFLWQKYEEAFFWIKKGGFSILDQGLFAGTNFILNVLLARWLSPEQYGTYSVALSVFYLLASFHTAILTEPMLVFGAGKYKQSFQNYLTILVKGHWIVTSVLALVFGIISGSFWLFHIKDLSAAFLGLAMALPSILFLWLIRKVFYIKTQPELALLGGGFYLILLLGMLYSLKIFLKLSVFTAFLIMGFASVAVTLFFLYRLHFWMRLSVKSLTSKMVLDSHWQYGRWSLGSTLLVWIPGNAYYLLLPLTAGLDASGDLRALTNLLMPALHTNSALSIVLVPYFARIINEKKIITLKKMIINSLLVFTAISLLFWLILIFFGKDIIFLFYGTKYSNYSTVLWIIGLLPVSAGIVAVLGGALRAMERPDDIFKSYGITTFIALSVGVLLMLRLDVLGSAIALLITSISTMLAMAWYLNRAFKY